MTLTRHTRLRSRSEKKAASGQPSLKRSGIKGKKGSLDRLCPIRRSGKPMKKKNAKRRQSEFARTYGGRERVEWIKSQPCAVSGVRGDIENVHTRGGGAGRKADAAFVIPLSRELHRQLHRLGKASFEAKWNVDLDAIAARVEADWQRSTNQRG